MYRYELQSVYKRTSILIEYAAGCVDYLYIFVVQEDKSNFSFEDRLHLVKLGTQHISNIIVEKSGELVENPRKSVLGKPISASLVRELLKEQDYLQIEKLVPITTLAYLKARGY